MALDYTFHKRGGRAAGCHMRHNPTGERAAASTDNGGLMAARSEAATVSLDLLECAPRQRPLAEEVLEGLNNSQKSLPAKLHYDERGSHLFEQICSLDEYYITRTELGIMRRMAGPLADALGDGCMLIEPGSGASLKTDLLLEAMESPAAYVPVDISRDFLLEAAKAIAARHDVEVLPVWADFTRPHPLPTPTAAIASRAVYFPGSTVGNFSRQEAGDLLALFGGLLSESAPGMTAGPAGSVVVGFDCKKDVARMEVAYNDSEGVTAEFNYNVLDRLSRELGTELDRDRFEFRASWDEDVGAIVSRLWAKETHSVDIAGTTVQFEAGEPIRMEESHKYTPAEFEKLAAAAGLGIEKCWTDEDRDFAVVQLRPLTC